MALTKSASAVWSGATLTAGAANTTSSVTTVDDSYHNAVHVKLTNGSAPTLPAQVQIEVSADNSEWYEYGGPMVGGTAGSTEYSWGGVPLDIGIEYIRFIAGSNTGQDVVVDVDITEVTGV